MATRTTRQQSGKAPRAEENGKAPRAEQSTALCYQSGFGNEFATEALTGALPVGQNSPQRAPYGLYAEQLSGTAFTAPRGANRRSWLYRIRPAAMHQPFRQLENARIVSQFDDKRTPPNQLRLNEVPKWLSASPFHGRGVSRVRGVSKSVIPRRPNCAWQRRKERGGAAGVVTWR